MSASNLTPIRAGAKQPVRVRKVKASAPDVELLAQAAHLLAFACQVYDEATDSDLHVIVRTARNLLRQWFEALEEENLDYSEDLHDAMGLVIMADMAYAAGIGYGSVTADPYFAAMRSAASLLRKAVRKPTDD